mmetsp:Transcript_25261/g.29211  ORF Transcript_25261/g.29211 Transcript_25261/m.29211 type:complete len:502 (-) Transcript_25261:232-1737(-)
MKIVSSIAFAAFYAAAISTTTDAFGPAQPLRTAASNTGTAGISMRINIGDKRRQGKILDIIETNPTKETVQSELLSDATSEELKKTNWKLRTTLLRKIRKQAARYELTTPVGFGVVASQSEREAAEIIAGAARQVVKAAANKSDAEELLAINTARKDKRAAKKVRTLLGAEARLANSKKDEAVAEPAAAAVEEAAPAAASEEAPAAASSGGEVTPKTIKQLRDETGAGMMDCKRALIESDGDQTVAAEFLRKKGLATADKKASRVASEGKIGMSVGADGKAVMVEVNCETDFVGKDSTFLGYVAKVAEAAATTGSSTVEDLLTQEVDGVSLENSRQALVSKIGENIQVRRMEGRGNGSTVVGGYVHMGSIGVLVELEGGTEQLCTDIAMHVTAMNPPFATADDVPQDVLENEKRILTEQALDSGKPEAIVEKIVEGRIRKYLEEKCLVSQNYVKDGDITVQKLLDNNDAKMIGFTRLVVGEGIEKKVDDFAAEVASMAAGK